MTAASTSTPRINASLISAYPNHTVTLVGRVMQLTGPTSATIQASDKGLVQIHLQPSPLTPNQIYEFVCTVNPSGQVHEQSRLAFNEDFDLDSYNEVVKLSHTPQFADGFYR